MGVGGGKMLFTRQSSGLVREVSVVNALFFNTAAFIGGTLGGEYVFNSNVISDQGRKTKIVDV